jgi:hypothetical protein
MARRPVARGPAMTGAAKDENAGKVAQGWT